MSLFTSVHHLGSWKKKMELWKMIKCYLFPFKLLQQLGSSVLKKSIGNQFHKQVLVWPRWDLEDCVIQCSRIQSEVYFVMLTRHSPMTGQQPLVGLHWYSTPVSSIPLTLLYVHTKYSSLYQQITRHGKKSQLTKWGLWYTIVFNGLCSANSIALSTIGL